MLVNDNFLKKRQEESMTSWRNVDFLKKSWVLEITITSRRFFRKSSILTPVHSNYFRSTTVTHSMICQNQLDYFFNDAMFDENLKKIENKFTNTNSVFGFDTLGTHIFVKLKYEFGSRRTTFMVTYEHQILLNWMPL